MGEKPPDAFGVWVEDKADHHSKFGREPEGDNWDCSCLETEKAQADVIAQEWRDNPAVYRATVHRLCLASERDALHVRLDEALEVLGGVEWAGWSAFNYDTYGLCPICLEAKSDGHADDCRLDAQLKKGGGDE